MEDYKNTQSNENGTVLTSGIPRASDIRREAREALRGNWKMALTLAAIVTAVVFAGTYLTTALMDWALMPMVKAQYSGAAITANMMITLIWVTVVVGVVLILVSSLELLVNARISRRVATYEALDFSALRLGLGDLFKGFRMTWVVWWRSMLLPMLLVYPLMIVYMLLMYTTNFPDGLYILILIAGIIGIMVIMFRCVYSYLPIDQMWTIDSSATARELANRSRDMMKGHRLRLFRLQMSFFGWLFLYGAVQGIAQEVLEAPEYQTALQVFSYVWGFASVPLLVYMQTAQAVFVRDLLARKGTDMPAESVPAEAAPAQAESAEAASAEDVSEEIAPAEENAASEEDKGE